MKLLPILTLLVACNVGPPPLYTTTDGIEVWGINNPGRSKLEEYTAITILFWKVNHREKDSSCWRVDGTMAFFDEADHLLNDDGTPIGGYQQDDEIHISFGSPRKIKVVFIHELSHILLERCMGWHTTLQHHEEMNRLHLERLWQ